MPPTRRVAHRSVVRKTIERLREAGVSVNVLYVVNGEVAKASVRRSLMRWLRMNTIQFIPCLDGLDGQTRITPERRSLSRLSERNL